MFLSCRFCSLSDWFAIFSVCALDMLYALAFQCLLAPRSGDKEKRFLDSRKVGYKLSNQIIDQVNKRHLICVLYYLIKMTILGITSQACSRYFLVIVVTCHPADNRRSIKAVLDTGGSGVSKIIPSITSTTKEPHLKAWIVNQNSMQSLIVQDQEYLNIPNPQNSH